MKRTVVFQKGITLIESLVALLVITIGVSALINLQYRSVEYSFDSLQQGVAVIHANDLVERFWSGACFIETAAVRGQIIDDWCETHGYTANCAAVATSSIADNTVSINMAIPLAKITPSAGIANTFSYQSSIPALTCD